MTEEELEKYVKTGNNLFMVCNMDTIKDGGNIIIKTTNETFYINKKTKKFHSEYPPEKENEVLDIIKIKYIMNRIEKYIKLSEEDVQINKKVFKELYNQYESIYKNKNLGKQTLICSAFPDTGKSTMYKKYLDSETKIIDSDSSNFDKKYFPENYLKHIKDNIGKVNIIFISSHKEVRNCLKSNNLHFLLVYPDKKLKNEYIERYKIRGNNESFIKLLENNWNSWLVDCEQQKGCQHIVLQSMEFIENVFVS